MKIYLIENENEKTIKVVTSTYDKDVKGYINNLRVFTKEARYCRENNIEFELIEGRYKITTLSKDYDYFLGYFDKDKKYIEKSITKKETDVTPFLEQFKSILTYGRKKVNKVQEKETDSELLPF